MRNNVEEQAGDARNSKCCNVSSANMQQTKTLKLHGQTGDILIFWHVINAFS